MRRPAFLRRDMWLSLREVAIAAVRNNLRAKPAPYPSGPVGIYPYHASGVDAGGSADRACDGWRMAQMPVGYQEPRARRV